MQGAPEGSAEKWRKDLGLVHAVLDGGAEARRELSTRMEFVPRALAAANARIGGPLTREDLADLSQDVVLRVWKKLGTYRGEATLESWTWRFCEHELWNRVRRRRRRRAVMRSGLENLPSGLMASEEEPGSVNYDHLEKGLSDLDPAEEEVIRLKHFEHLMFTEIAERLEISPNTAKTRYYRGITRLRRALEREEQPER